jgi:hypothetical protein
MGKEDAGRAGKLNPDIHRALAKRGGGLMAGGDAGGREKFRTNSGSSLFSMSEKQNLNSKGAKTQRTEYMKDSYSHKIQRMDDFYQSSPLRSCQACRFARDFPSLRLCCKNSHSK